MHDRHDGDHERGGSDSHEHSHSHEDGGSHSHEHSHSHEDGGSHPHDELAAAPRRIPIEAGAGAGKVLFFDCFSGVAGDMTIAALLDLGVPVDVVRSAVAALPVEGYEIVVSSRTQSGIVATKFDVVIDGAQPARRYGDIDDMLASAKLAPAVVRLARAIFRRLGEAEAQAHQMPLRDVHFHEVGAVDAIVDIVGAAAALTHVGATVVCSPLPMTRGFVTAQHGVLPLPAPATLSVLADVPTYGIALDREIVTPTGAAIVATAAARFERWPAMAPCAVGYGAGTMSLVDRPNLLRLVLGQPVVERATEATHVVLECNVDDMSGELVAHALDVLRREGAVDAWATANTMKKGRPGLMISALATRSAADHLGLVMLRETTSIGLRRSEVSRIERPREIVSVETAYGVIDLKVSGGAFGPPLVKPEFEHCRQAADAHNVPVREVLRAALVAFDEASRR